MADTAKILGQVSDASSEDTLYFVPAVTSTVVSSVVVCNRGATDTTFTIGVHEGAGTLGAGDYLYYQAPIRAGDTFIATIGATLAAADRIQVVSGNASVTFNAFGIEST